MPISLIATAIRRGKNNQELREKCLAGLYLDEVEQARMAKAAMTKAGAETKKATRLTNLSAETYKPGLKSRKSHTKN